MTVHQQLNIFVFCLVEHTYCTISINLTVTCHSPLCSVKHWSLSHVTAASVEYSGPHLVTGTCYFGIQTQTTT